MNLRYIFGAEGQQLWRQPLTDMAIVTSAPAGFAGGWIPGAIPIVEVGVPINLMFGSVRRRRLDVKSFCLMRLIKMTTWRREHLAESVSTMVERREMPGHGTPP